MRWSDEIILIGEVKPDDETEGTNDNGFSLPAEETRTTVFGNKKSVGYAEFFKAQQAGISEEMKFDVFTEEYEGQPLAEYGGKRYEILRTYVDPKTSGEYTELTLSDLSQRGGRLGGTI